VLRGLEHGVALLLWRGLDLTRQAQSSVTKPDRGETFP
jgi:hypothetical protein